VIRHGFASEPALTQAPAKPRLDNGRAVRKGSPSLFVREARKNAGFATVGEAVAAAF
jgi:hypothetical protein